MAVISESAVEDRLEEAPGREGMRRECRKAFCMLCVLCCVLTVVSISIDA